MNDELRAEEFEEKLSQLSDEYSDLIKSITINWKIDEEVSST